MTRIKHALVAAAAAMATLIGVPGIANAQMDHNKMDATQMASMTDGEIRKVDKEAATTRPFNVTPTPPCAAGWR